MKKHKKKLIIMGGMTILYTTILVFYFVLESQSIMILNNITSSIKNTRVEWSLQLLQKSQEVKNVVETKKNPSKIKINIKKESLPTYHIKALLDEENYQIKGQLELTVDNPRTESVLFYTYPYSWLPMEIKKVYLNEMEVPFSYDQQQLTFKNQKEVKKLHIMIEFKTPIPRRGTRFGYKDDIWLLTTWYPMLGVMDDNQKWLNRPDPIGMGDPYLFNFANYVVEWTSSPSIKWLSSGKLVSEKMVNDKRRTTWKINSVRNFALVGSDNYKIKKLKLNENTTVSIALTDEKNFTQINDIIKFSFPLFLERYGQLPYSDLAIVETGHNTNFALEYPNIAVFSKDMYMDNQIEHWLPHEIGHMWWYNAVGVNEIKNGWIDEGLAELGVVLYLENRYSKLEGQKLRNKYRERNRLLIKNSPHQTLDVGLYGHKSQQEFYDSWYARSGDMFLTLREKIGDEKFTQFLNTLYKTNIGKTIDEKSIADALYKSSTLKTDLFQNWIHEPYHQTNWDINVIKSPNK
jgi:hypothetical protein